MAKFNLDDYENVYERKKRFYDDNPKGRIIVDVINADINMALIKCTIYLTDENIPKSTGHAFEFRDKEKKVNKWGKEFESVNFSSWVENCETSAIGRALSNAGYASNDKCSKEEMQKVENHSSLPFKNNQGLGDPKKEAPKKIDPKLIPLFNVMEGFSLKNEDVLKVCNEKFNNVIPSNMNPETIQKLIEELTQ